MGLSRILKSSGDLCPSWVSTKDAWIRPDQIDQPCNSLVNDIRLGMEVTRVDLIQDLSVALYCSILIIHQLLFVQF